MSTLKTNNIQHVDRSEPSILIDTSGSVSIFWNYNGQGATPYYALASFMFSAAATNNTSANKAENLITSCHVGGNYYLSARSLTASSSTTALQVAINGWNAAANSEFIVKYKRIF